jgi:AraC-like DNA-binding protein
MRLRQLYTPVQPTVKQSAENVTYVEHNPHPSLQEYIYCYWELKTTSKLTTPFEYRVVADGCIDVFFELNNPSESFVMGFCKQFTSFPLEHSFHYVGIRFLPTMFPQLFNISALALSNRFENLNSVLPKFSSFLSNRFHSNGLPLGCSSEKIKVTLNHYFLQLVEKTSFRIDNRLYLAIEKIMRQPSEINIEQGLKTGWSPRQLRRQFEYYIGDTAKTFAQVVRFQQVLRAKPSTQSLRKNKLFFEVGYYDQAHFIKEFKKFYGVTPSKAFDRT